MPFELYSNSVIAITRTSYNGFERTYYDIYPILMIINLTTLPEMLYVIYLYIGATNIYNIISVTYGIMIKVIPHT